jgi:hypothetical protein
MGSQKRSERKGSRGFGLYAPTQKRRTTSRRTRRPRGVIERGKSLRRVNSKEANRFSGPFSE